MADIARYIQGMKSKSFDSRSYCMKKAVEAVEETQSLPNELLLLAKKLVDSSDNSEKLTGLSLLNKLCEVLNEGNLNLLAEKFFKKMSFRELASKEEEVVLLASQTMGKLLQCPSTTTSALAEEEFNLALATLRNDTSKDGVARFAACCEIKEISQRMPILFAVYMTEFVGCMWNAIKDNKDYIRDIGVQVFALGAQQMVAREDLKTRILEECISFLSAENQPALIQGALLVLHHIVISQKEMIAKALGQILQKLVVLCEHKSALVRQGLLEIIPDIVDYAMKANYREMQTVSQLLDYLLATANNSSKDIKVDAFPILGRIAIVLGRSFDPFLPDCVKIIKSELKKKPILPSLFELMRGISRAVGVRFLEHVTFETVLDSLFVGTDLNTYLIDCTNELIALMLATNNRASVITLCDKLLIMLHGILNKSSEAKYNLPKNPPGDLTALTPEVSFTESFLPIHMQMSDHNPRNLLVTICTECTDHSTNILKVLALFTLSKFDFHNAVVLTPLVHTCVLPYLEDSCVVMRQYAVITTTALVRFPSELKTGSFAHTELLNIIERLLNVALTDSSHLVRHTLFKSIQIGFFPFLALENNLSKLMIAVNDESILVRRACLKVLGKLVPYNSSFILPYLTQLLGQYMNEVYLSTRAKEQTNAAILLRTLIKHSRQLISHNLSWVIDIYLKLLRSSTHAPLISQILLGISACAEACRHGIIPYFDDIFPQLIENMKDSAFRRRKAALQAALNIVSCTGMAISPYLKYPNLLDTLLALVQNEESVELRKLAEKCVGKYGALDPLKHKEHLKQKNKYKKPSRANPLDRHLSELREQANEQSPSYDIYYPLVALKALMK